MKIRLRRRSDTDAALIASALQRLQTSDATEGLANPEFLKRNVRLSEFLAWHLEQDGEQVGDTKWMFHCFRPDHHTNGDANASLYCYDDYAGTGVGRWGCICTEGGDDIYGFCKAMWGDSMLEAVGKVRRWYRSHQPRIRVRLRRRNAV